MKQVRIFKIVHIAIHSYTSVTFVIVCNSSSTVLQNRISIVGSTMIWIVLCAFESA